jgi:hypothetical protein
VQLRGRIRVGRIRPFKSRRDSVLSLQFAYDETLVGLLKGALRRARAKYGGEVCGGWLPGEHCWFVERHAFDFVRRLLEQQGYGFRFALEVDLPVAGEPEAPQVPDAPEDQFGNFRVG